MQPTQTQGSGPAKVQQQGGRIKYADPKDLPSYPSLGLKRGDSAASAAATIGWASQRTAGSSKTPKTSAYSTSTAASTAALLAHDNGTRTSPKPSDKSTASWKTTASASKPPVSPQRERPANLVSMSSSAAAQAFRRSPQLSPRDSQFSGISRQSPTLSANGAPSAISTRPRAQSSPLSMESTPDQRSAALSAATLAHGPSIRSRHTTPEPSASPYTTLPRPRFTATPPARTEAEDQRKNDELHASAVAMARKMYTQQQAIIDMTKRAHGQEPSRTPVQPMPSLQETAYKLAQDRVAKLSGGESDSRGYQGFYGPSPVHRRFRARNMLRRRASSDSDAMGDRRQSEHIQQQMSLFNSKLNEVDEQKREAHRQALLATARKNVKAQLAGMDSMVQKDAGRVRSVSNEWQLKAQAVARLKSEERTGVNHHGQVDIGGGNYIDMKDVEAIASKRMEPILSEINRKAEEDRKRVAQLQAEQEAKKKEAEEKKAKARDIKEVNKKQKEQDKHAERERKAKEKQDERERRGAQKQEERQRKEEERAKKEEEKTAKAGLRRQAREEKRRNKELAAAAKATEKLRRKQEERQTQQPSDHINHGAESDTESDESLLLSSRPSTPMSTNSNRQAPAEGNVASPTSSKAKVKTWFKHKFSRSRAGSSAAEEEDYAKSRPSAKESSFAGGAALSRGNYSVPGRGDNSMKDVAVAGRRSESQFPHFVGEGQSEVPVLRSVGPLADSDDDEEFVMAPGSRVGSDESGSAHAQGLRTVPQERTALSAFDSATTAWTGSLPRDSRFKEAID